MPKKVVKKGATAKSSGQGGGAAAGKKYTLQIELGVLDHLAGNLYSNVPAVLTEMVANAWDADAKEVRIDVDLKAGKIVVTDDGFGMTAKDINEKFLTVGYRKREQPGGDVTPGGRPVMGRKGVGKLAPFSIADSIEVYSRSKNQKSGLLMTTAGIRTAKKRKKSYHPDVRDSSELIPKKGTTIVLTELKMERFRRPNFRERLARRFSVIGTEEFRVFLDGVEITGVDRGDLQVLQYIWTLGDWKKPNWCTAKRESELPEKLDGWIGDWKVKGWIGTSHKPKDLEKVSGNLNGVVVLARGRLFQENILSNFNDGRHYTKYLTGQIEVDFLDDGDADMATSDRQRLIEDDERYVQLQVYLKSVLNKLESQWSVWRSLDDPEVVEDKYPQVRVWIESLGDERIKRDAKKLIGAVERLALAESEKVEVLKHSIFGFERMKLKGRTAELAEAVSLSDAALIKLFADQDALEAGVYRDIVKGRLGEIRLLKDAVDKNEKEKVLQQLLFDRLWLLDPSWERATGSPQIEQQFKKLFPSSSDEKDEEASKGRFDITYRTAAGKHIIVELKRANRSVTLAELSEQGMKYVDELNRLLVKHGAIKEGFQPDIEVIFVLGNRVPEQQNNVQRYKNQMDAISVGSRVKTYEELVSQALDAYKDYLEKTKDLGSLSDLIESIG
ncbi:ATP-binding protein [Xanthomonas campestris pv. campestris]|uniref:BbrUII/HgiDII family restriction enzyme n=1 Tax=Xanthomonas campestris TaxID=339 RepID=UPI00265C3900|nr:ATP-binding protein [Xanthomonas campestris]MDO0791815.1 ATP-binding protein [Xanthomonas campestris pv. campestris]